MIGQLRGKLAEKHPNQVIVDVGGVGYQVQIPLSTYSSLGNLHDDTTLLIHTHLREDQLLLYGFLTVREKQLFELLLSASGVGPNLALRILSGMSVDELVPAIRRGDLERLVRIPGIGKKTAERIVVELRDKLMVMEAAPTAAPAWRTPVEADVASALINLGYDRRLVEKAVEQSHRAAAEGSFDELLRAALQQLTGGAAQNAARAGRGET